MISEFYKQRLRDETKGLIDRIIVNGQEINQFDTMEYSDGLTLEFALPEAVAVTTIEFYAGSELISQITGLSIDTSVVTHYSHNITFSQEG